MKRQTLLSVLAVMLAGIVHSQQTEKRFLIEAAAGASFPIGKFADKDQSVAYTGLAKPGPLAQLTLGYMFSKHWGAMLQVGGSFNKRDDKKVRESLEAKYPAGSLKTSIDMHTWKTWRLMAGGIYEAVVCKKSGLRYNAGLLAGFCKSAIPASEIAYYEYNGNGGMSGGTASLAKAPLPWTFCYKLQTGLKYRFNKTLGVGVTLGYFASSRELPYWQAVNVPSGVAPGGTVTLPWSTTPEKLKLNAVDALVSLEIRL